MKCQAYRYLSKVVSISISPHLYATSDVDISAGTNPTFWARGLASLGLMGARGLVGTHGLAYPIEELLSFKTSSS